MNAGNENYLIIQIILEKFMRIIYSEIMKKCFVLTKQFDLDGFVVESIDR